MGPDLVLFGHTSSVSLSARRVSCLDMIPALWVSSHNYGELEARVPPNPPLRLVAKSICLAPGGILTFQSYKDDFRYNDKTTVSAVMVSLQNVGAFLAALCIFPISERYGRKKTVQVAMAIFCVGVILQVVPSHSLVCFYIGRFISGLGLGGGTAVVPSYNAEMAPKEIRGMLGSGVQWLFALGVMISYWIDYAVQQTLPVSSAQWQIPIGLQLVPATVLALGLFTQPESVRWLAKKERFDEAWQSLTWMRASDGKHI